MEELLKVIWRNQNELKTIKMTNFKKELTLKKRYMRGEGEETNDTITELKSATEIFLKTNYFAKIERG